MRNRVKKWLSILTLSAVVVSGIPTGNVAQAAEQTTKSSVKLPENTNEIVTPDNPMVFRDLSSEEIIKEMGAGWNLGNTLDGHTGLTPSETAWQPAVTTKATIKLIHDAGFNTVRVPVTWGNMINADYSVRESWMNRVQDIVDYCIEQDMYVILNMHHDGAEAMYWFNLKEEGANLDKVYEKFQGLWKTIAERFKNYDEHLIFESMNEIQGGKWDQKEAGTQFGVNINKANQIFVDTVRGTGSNNSKRWLSIPPWGTRIAVALNADEYGFKMPKDTLANSRIMLAIHDYAPINKCLNGTSREDNDITLKDVINSYEDNFIGLSEQYVKKGIPVVLAEYGAVDKDNLLKRELYCEAVNILARKHQIVGVYWDDGGVDNNAFAFIDRKKNTLRAGYETLVYALMRGFFTQTDITKVTAGTEIIPITDFELEEQVSVVCNDMLQLEISKVQPENHNDVIVWKTSNPAVATVYNGLIRGRSVGETTVTAYTQSGKLAKTVKVTVKAQTGTACDNIVLGTEMDKVPVYMGYGSFLNAKVGTKDCNASLRYYSENEGIATVSATGKITGISVGSTNIVIVSSTGFTRKVPVSVENAPWDNSKFRLALHIYYNDTEHNFYDDLMSSDIVTITGPGQYHVKFDCAADLTSRAKEAGITTINNAGAIYLKDVDVDEGNISKSVLKSGNISYQKILVNGEELAIADTAKNYPLVKSNHIIDTNNPINSWGDYAILEEEVNVANNQITYKKVAEPTVIEVYFTVSEMYYDDGTHLLEPETSESPVVTPTEPPKDSEVSEPSLKKGTIIADDAIQAQYKIVKTEAGKREVAYIKTITKKSSVVIPATVTIKGEKYKVTGIAKKAFYKNKKLKKITLGKNIITIGEKAFYGCKSLKKIVIQTEKLSKVGKKAFGNIAKNTNVQVPKSKKKAYKKFFS